MKDESSTCNNSKGEILMGYYTKEIYEKKQKYAEVLRMRDKMECETLTVQQHEALARLCSFRHNFHSTKEQDFFYSECSNILDEISFNDINEMLELALLPPIDFPDTMDLPTDTDYYEVLNENDRQEWEDKADIINSTKTKHSFYHTGCSLYYEEAAGIILNFKEGVNEAIEKYLGKIDLEHGTHYCPTGLGRLGINTYKKIELER